MRTVVANFEPARKLVDPYADVEGDIDEPVYPGWRELQPRLEELLGPPTFQERATDGSTRFFWAFADEPECHYFTFWVNEKQEGHGGVETGHESRPEKPGAIDAHAECVGWAGGKRVGTLYKTD